MKHSQLVTAYGSCYGYDDHSAWWGVPQSPLCDPNYKLDLAQNLDSNYVVSDALRDFRFNYFKNSIIKQSLVGRITYIIRSSNSSQAPYGAFPSIIDILSVASARCVFVLFLNDLESSFLFLFQIGTSSVVAQTFSFRSCRLVVLESGQLCS